MSRVNFELKQQKESNKAALKYYSDFESHRQQQTQYILSSVTEKSERICILGAGNCYDIDLERIAAHFSEIHLVDIDRDALINARARVSPAVMKKLFLHAPVDVSCANKKMEAWLDMKVSPEALMAFPETAVKSLLKKLPGPFDCVVSSCILSQIMLTLRRVLGEQHPLFEAGLITLIITHLKALSALTTENGQALLITDVSSDDVAPLAEFPKQTDGLDFLQKLIQNHQTFHYLAPELLATLAQQDPALEQAVTISEPQKAWLWHNGPKQTFLVYALALMKKTHPELSEGY